MYLIVTAAEDAQQRKHYQRMFYQDSRMLFLLMVSSQYNGREGQREEGEGGQGEEGEGGDEGEEANTDENKNNYHDHNHKPLLIVHHLTMEDNGKLYDMNIKRK